MVYQKNPGTTLNLSAAKMLKNMNTSNIGEEFVQMINIYEGALKEISAKIEILDAEFQTLHDHNPIHHIESRIKSLKSILDKIIRKNYEPTVENIREYIMDIVGLRIICPYIEDVYTVAALLTSHHNLEIMKRVDYIRNPKENGYRSVHLVVRVPVTLSSRVEFVPVEVQLRTIAMDMWASLEHELRYKAPGTPEEELLDQLKECASSLAETDMKMQNLYSRTYILQGGSDS